MGAVSQCIAQSVALIVLRIDAADGVHGQSLTVRAFPLAIVDDYQQQERLNVNVVKLQHSATEGKLRISLDELKHPLLIILELHIAVIHVLLDMALELVDELLLVETIELLWDEDLVATEGRHHTACQSKALEVTTNLTDALT